jgi:hypothetical protein
MDAPPALPEPVVRVGIRPEPAAVVLSDALRRRLIGRGRTEWFGSVGQWTRCAICHRKMDEGDPVRFRYGRTARDMATQGWCCSALDEDTVKAALRAGGYKGHDGNAPEPVTKDEQPTATRPRGGGLLST